MTDEIIGLTDERRSLMNKNERLYKLKHNLMKHKTKKATQMWIMTKCEELQELQRKPDEFNGYKKVKKTQTKYTDSYRQ